MSETPNNPSVPSTLKRVAYNLRLAGWIGFWVQVVLAVVSTFIFLIAIAQPRANDAAAASNPGTGGSILMAICGVLALYFSIYQFFRYTRLARQLKEPNPNLRPKRADTIKILRFGLIVNLVGLLLAVLAAEAMTGTIQLKFLFQPQGAAVYDPQYINRLVQPLDVLVVLGNTHTITAHFGGIIASLWLLNSVTKQ